ncbi:MAG: AI-2E family transporter [Synechococcus sp. Tobar2m-G35]|jgi:predicted PurR-regulated permease PerM|nr:AI-2E family transporter [Synechococcus sp. Tobar2m-G35]
MTRSTTGFNWPALLGSVALVLLGLMAWELRWVLMVLFGAIVLAVALDVPVQVLMRRLHLGRPAALTLVLAAFGSLATVLVLLLLPEVVDQVQTLIRILPALLAYLASLSGRVPALSEFQDTLRSLSSFETLQPLGSQLLGLAGGAANGTIQVLLMALLAVLLCLDPASHTRLVLAATPRFYRQHMRRLLQECRDALGGWLAGMTLSAAAVFLATWAGLALIGAPLALLSGLISGVLTFVPTVGPTLATLLPAAVALLLVPKVVVKVILLRLLLQNLEAFVLTPLLLKRTVNLLPTVALMGQLSLGALLGLPGVLLALPFIVVTQVLLEEVLVREIMDRWTLRVRARP